MNLSAGLRSDQLEELTTLAYSLAALCRGLGRRQKANRGHREETHSCLQPTYEILDKKSPTMIISYCYVKMQHNDNHSTLNTGGRVT